MKNTIETRKACNQREPATKNTTELRENFLTAKIFLKDEIQSNPAKFYFNSAAICRAFFSSSDNSCSVLFPFVTFFVYQRVPERE